MWQSLESASRFLCVGSLTSIYIVTAICGMTYRENQRPRIDDTHSVDEERFAISFERLAQRVLLWNERASAGLREDERR